MKYDIASATFGRSVCAVRMSGRNEARQGPCGLAAFLLSASSDWGDFSPEQSQKSARTRLSATVQKGKTRLVIQMGHCFPGRQTDAPVLPAKRPMTVVEVSGAKSTSANERPELSAILGMDLIGTYTARPYIKTKPLKPALDRYAQPSRVVSQHPVQRDVTV